MQKSTETMKRRGFKVAERGIASCALAAVMTMYLPSMALAGSYDIDEGSVDIHAYEDKTEVTHGNNAPVEDSSPTVYSVTGETTQNTVTITAEANTTANVTLSGVNINTREYPNSIYSNGAAAVSVNGAGNVIIELEGNNNLTSGSHHAGLEDNLGGTVTINDADNDGSLSANGGSAAAGIGGGYSDDGSNITINGGNVTAIGGDNAAGIGGGAYGNGTTIAITGGVVIAVCGGDSGAGIGGGLNRSGNAITISGSAQVSAAGGNPYVYTSAGAAIGNGGSGDATGAEAEIDTTGLYTNGSIVKYTPGSTAEAIAAGTAEQVGDTVVGTVEPPVDPGPQSLPRAAVAAIVTADDSYAPATTTTAEDVDAAFYAAVDMQVEDLLKEINALIAEGNLDKANVLIAKGLKINAGTHKGFNASTLAKLGEASRMGIAVTVNFVYAGTSYSVTIPGHSVIDPVSLVDQNGYCGFLNLVKYFG